MKRYPTEVVHAVNAAGGVAPLHHIATNALLANAYRLPVSCCLHVSLPWPHLSGRANPPSLAVTRPSAASAATRA